MKTFTGTVISTKMQKTATISVETKWQHPTYKKIIKKSKKFLTHNQLNAADGDTVEVTETKPQSKRKKWTITKIIAKTAAK